ncbi:MAG: SDR family NAD(P)-dependent oxidoreductase [Lachnospiraceae bacterium]|nr:SDR family NAD(P)-dependent oxidoreductase [uncultured Acetatifactor sp.]MCI9219707.1 SDR family NAD(P)-dependent oxidoreductase [Lachnospiraceae bacterium]
MNIIIITGASSGIGKEFARQTDAHFNCIDEFWLVARSQDRLQQLAGTLRHRTRIFAMDITRTDSLDLLEDTALRYNAAVRMLINCAGYGIMGNFCEQDAELASGMIQVNCRALTDLTHRMIPYMRWGSRIIQMASSAAFLPQPGFAVYAATKAYVLSFSRALGEELRNAGIYVTSVCPGPVDTPFFDIAEATGSTLAVKKYTMVDAERVVSLALRDSYRKRTMSVCSLPIKAFRILSKTLPHSAVLHVMEQMKKKGL